VKNAVSYIGQFEDTLAGEARRHGADGVICGHIHHAIVRDIADTVYVNCGDWVESCSAVVEHFDGRLEIVVWTDFSSLPGSPPTQLPEPLPISARDCVEDRRSEVATPPPRARSVRARSSPRSI
jgi:hypothetical protein